MQVVRVEEFSVEVCAVDDVLVRGGAEVRMAVDGLGRDIHVADQEHMMGLGLGLERQGFRQHMAVEAEFVVVTGALGCAGGGTAVAERSPVGPVRVQEGEVRRLATWGGDGERGDEDPAFEIPGYGAGGAGEVGNGETLREVVANQGCNAVDFAAEAGGVVFVTRKGEVDCVGGVGRSPRLGILKV